MVDYKAIFDTYQTCQRNFGYAPHQLLVLFCEQINNRPSKFLRWRDLACWVDNKLAGPQSLSFNIYNAFLITESVQNGTAVGLYGHLAQHHLHQSPIDLSQTTIYKLQDRARSLMINVQSSESEIIYAPSRDWSITPPYASDYFRVLKYKVDEFIFFLTQYLEALQEINDSYLNQTLTIVQSKIKNVPDELVFPLAISKENESNQAIIAMLRAYKTRCLFNQLKTKNTLSENELLWHSGIYL